MRVLVTGGSGYVGNAVTDAFCRAGHLVKATVRRLEKAHLVERFGAEAVVWDLRDFRTLIQEIASCDVLVHTAMDMGSDSGAADRECVTFFLEELVRSTGLRRFLYTSGVWVLGNTRDHRISDNIIPDSAPANVAWRPQVERIVLNSAGEGITSIVIRPGIVYGGAGGLVGFLLDNASVDRGVEVVGDGKNHWSPVHRSDLADLYVRAAEFGPVAAIFNGTDGSCPTVDMIATALSNALGFDGRVSHIPKEEALKKLGGLAQGLLLDQCVSGDYCAKVLGWVPRHRSIVSDAPALVRSWKAASHLV